MAQEEQSQKCSNSSSGTCGGGNVVRSSKKQKAKKVPQRGLGVAQLERIRLEEQQKRDGITVLTSPTSSSISPTKSSSLSLPITPNYHPSSPYSIPFPPDHFSSSNLILRPSSSLQNNEILNSNTAVPLTNPPVGWSTVPIHQGQASVHKLWNSCDYNLEKRISGLDPGIAFRSNLNACLPYESIPIWPLPGLMHKAHQYQQPSSMMVGMKRAYPFSLDNPPTFSSLHCKFQPTVLPLSRSDDSTSCSSGHTLNSEPSYPIFREGSNSKRNIKENGVVNGGFLSLAPPTTSPKCQSSKFRHSPPSLAFNNSESPNFDSLSYPERVQDPLFQPGPGGSNPRQPYYSFFPRAMASTDQATGSVNNFNGGEVGHDQSVDLNLKL
ncbi:hypothetical protein JRO89_XS15G0098600 [Xanthoceras sorbifolium]|uniref:Uncharacterized protein n=1 Tax=Xanthoceras sorbifolium TaxID=99658 RepID=A0ABQ8H1J5_9ROSI|nr:hypothetical protein JRO89_XS15G0098600 [Xanthoceras sorbifolium]